MLRFLILAALLFPTTVSGAPFDEIRIELPPGSQLKVRNDYGNLDVEQWDQTYAAVSYTIEGSATLTRSPILINNQGKLVTISVVRRPTDPRVAVHLKLKIPANVEITTWNGGSYSKPEIQVSTDARRVLTDAPPRVSTDGPPKLIGADGAKTPAGTPADKADNVEISEGDIIRVDSQLVTLNVSVVDRGTSRGLAGLVQSDFKLFEDGQEQRIVQFESSSAPFDLVLLIDLSGSTKEVVKLIRAAALRFVNAARPADRIAVITFAGTSSIVSGLTADRDLLRRRIETIDTVRGDTKLYDAINFTMNQVKRDANNSRRAAIVVMSDGLDGTIPGISGQVGSQIPYRETLSNIQEFDGVLYTLWLNTEYVAMSPEDTQPEAFDAGYDRMKEMAESGGGVFYPVERLTDLAGAYEQVVADLGTVYSLAYKPSNGARDGQWRAIKIGIDRSNAVARGKRGYYAN
ncbi:MAG TPA: VWA domain-containing protein [Pyrinomonadaceae bacterium]|nr:VWA domain-containing protein [Pyrinomonadaceae bacterium]